MASGAEQWLRLVHAPGVGVTRRRRLLARFGDPAAIAAAPKTALAELGVGRAAMAVLRGAERPAAIDRELAWAEAPDCHLLTPDCPAWPERLRTLADPPALLYARGDPEVLSQAALAIVGSRNPSAAGAETAYELARHLAAAGLVIVSGLALGIDGAAHEGALAGDGLTIGVAGTGRGRRDPARHADLARRMTAEGAVISELPLGTRPSRGAFPRRNRIVTGLCLGTLVVEAAPRSGSLISARHALEQGREVFAIPGSIHNPLARGCHQLIREGAKLVETADDVLEELAPQLQRPAEPAAPAPTVATAAAAVADDPEYAGVLGALDWEPRGVDDVAARSGLAPGTVASVLLRLELDGVIRALPGGLYQRR